MSDENLLTLTVDIVSAHLSNNSVSTVELTGLIETVYASLGALGQPDPVVEVKPEPAVSIRSSVKTDAITCLECGVRLKMLKRHLHTHHHYSPEEYRSRWGLSSDYPLVASDYAARRSDLAREIGLGRKPEARPKSAARSKAAAKATPAPSVRSDSDSAPEARAKPARKPRAKAPAPAEA